MEGITPLLVFVLLLTLWAEFVNGSTDAPNAIATIVSTKVLSPKRAVVLATALNILGTFSGTAVAATIGQGIVNPEIISLQTVAAAMVGIILWSSVAWKYGLPTSESHALISGLAGAGFAVGGFRSLEWEGWKKVLIGLGFSTFLGFILAYLIFVAIVWIFNKKGISKVRKIFGKLQILSAGFMAFGHGSNDGQKFIGAFSLALLLAGVTKEFTVPVWVIFLCAGMMGLGTSIGGWRIIKTMGMKLSRLEPQHGFAAETAAATAIEIASRFGIPLSTTHTINTAIMGVGSAQHFSGVRWQIAKNIIFAWILTFPICAFISWGVAKIFLLFGS
ncbi:inorganic phosphate transporter [Candidatus Microgenomates bacterium]|nr:inorganic phosphate transporter [Candidatus Microgenomates bacterium]